MRCEEVQERLSEYLERLLDSGQSKSVDGHLASCPRCTAELADLTECRRLVAALPALEPPVGFTTRVMAHIRESAEQPGWWQRLFLPLRAKLPLPATALLLVSVLSVYLLQKENPQKKLIPPIAAQVETEALKQAGDAAQGLTANVPSSPRLMLREDSAIAEKMPGQPKALQTPLEDRAKKEAAPAPKPAPNVKSSAGAQAASKAAPETRALPQSAAEERANRVESAAAEAELPPTPSRPISGAIGVSQPAGGRPVPASPSMDAIMQDRSLRAAMPERARTAPAQPTADIEIVIRRHPQSDSADLMRKESAAPNTGGLAASRAATAPAPSEPLLRTIPADQYEQLKKELASQGTILSEVRTANGQPTTSPTLTVKITFVPAEVAR
ncbi:MAG: DUF2275 domain-containing protein [Deltaproteobacteria bacterium]|nr:DUF2275 domain-containing protein [Deltaproteobacteria bacterium]